MSRWSALISRAIALAKVIRLKRVGIALFSILIVGIAAYFVYAMTSAWKAQEPTAIVCGFLPSNPPLSYIQYNVKDQAVEPFFHGTIFVNLGYGPGPSQAELITTAAPLYANTSTHVEFFKDELAKSFWMRKESDEVPLVRTSRSARDFPFDTTVVEFETTFNPPLSIQGVMLRNFNSSFNMPCDKAAITVVPGKVHARFVMRRKPLVQLMAVVILVSATLFVLIIPFSVKREALATSVASFFFSIWSTRGILASEMKVFPTTFDLAILTLCVFLLLMIGFRLLYEWGKSKQTLEAQAR